MEFRVVSPDGSPDANDTEVCEDLHRAHSTHSMLNLSSPLLDDTGHKTPVTLNSRLVENYLTNLIEIWVCIVSTMSDTSLLLINDFILYYSSWNVDTS
jgi:hypothetical protein